MKNWKTTAAGFLAVLAGALSASHHATLFEALKDLQVDIALIVGIGLMLAKDGNVTGGTSGQPSTPQALADANQAPASGADAPKETK